MKLTMGKPNKRPVRKRKCTCKCHVRQSLEMRKKGQQIAKRDTLPQAPAQTLLPTNGVTFKVKMRKK